MPAKTFTCPGCRATLQLAAAPPAGQGIQCPQCRTVFTLAGPPAATGLRSGRPAYYGDSPRAPRQRGVHTSGSNRGLMLGLAVGGTAFALLVVLAGAVAVAAYVWKSKPARDASVATADEPSPDGAGGTRGEADSEPAPAAPKRQGVLDLLENMSEPGAAENEPPAPRDPPGQPDLRPPQSPTPPMFRRPAGPGSRRPRVPRGPRLPGLATNWRPDPAMLVRLGPETFLGEYRIRPPSGYTLESRVKAGVEYFHWKGSPRSDGTFPQLLATMVPVPPEGRDAPPDVVFDAVLEGCKKGQATLFPAWRTGSREEGHVNGIPFTRVRITGRNPTGGVRMNGFAYMAIDNNTLLFLLSQDLVPNDGDSLRLAEASTLTLRR